VLITNYHRFLWQVAQAHRRALGLSLGLDVGSAARRIKAMRSVAPSEITRLNRHSGLLEAFAELESWRFVMTAARAPAATPPPIGLSITTA
jgi:hypothetical protein